MLFDKVRFLMYSEMNVVNFLLLMELYYGGDFIIKDYMDSLKFKEWMKKFNIIKHVSEEPDKTDYFVPVYFHSKIVLYSNKLYDYSNKLYEYGDEDTLILAPFKISPLIKGEDDIILHSEGGIDSRMFNHLRHNIFAEHIMDRETGFPVDYYEFRGPCVSNFIRRWRRKCVIPLDR